jgi:hypothetical protein
VDAGAEVGNQQELAGQLALTFQGDHEARQPDPLPLQRGADGGLIPGPLDLLQRLGGPRVIVLEAGKIDALEGGHGVPVPGQEIVPGDVPVAGLALGAAAGQTFSDPELTVTPGRLGMGAS